MISSKDIGDDNNVGNNDNGGEDGGKNWSIG